MCRRSMSTGTLVSSPTTLNASPTQRKDVRLLGQSDRERFVRVDVNGGLFHLTCLPPHAGRPRAHGPQSLQRFTHNAVLCGEMGRAASRSSTWTPSSPQICAPR